MSLPAPTKLSPKRMLVIFFVALSVTLLVLLLSFSVFFKNLDFGIKAKQLELLPGASSKDDSNPYLGTNTANAWRSDALEARLDINVPEEAQRMLEEEKKTASASSRTNEEAPLRPYLGVGLNPKADAASASPPSASEKDAETEPFTEDKAQGYRAYLGGFFSREDAQATVKQLQQQGQASQVRQTTNGFEVQLGQFPSRSDAEQVAARFGASVEPL